MKTFGEIISELRKECGLTQRALAAQVKKKDGTAIGLVYMNDIENDRRGPPGPNLTTQLAKALKAAPEVLEFYAGRIFSDGLREREDPPYERIVAAYRAFYQELEKRPNNGRAVDRLGTIKITPPSCTARSGLTEAKHGNELDT